MPTCVVNDPRVASLSVFEKVARGSQRRKRQQLLGGGEARGVVAQVSGTIPTQFGNLRKLTEFMMDNNTLSGTIPDEITNMGLLEKFVVNDNKLSGTIPEALGDITFLNWWDSFGNKLEGELPTTIQKLGSVDYLYLQNEHLFALRNHFCHQRIEASAIGRKYNWAILANEYINYKQVSGCAEPFDVEAAFGTLSGDV